MIRKSKEHAEKNKPWQRSHINSLHQCSQKKKADFSVPETLYMGSRGSLSEVRAEESRNPNASPKCLNTGGIY